MQRDPTRTRAVAAIVNFICVGLRVRLDFVTLSCLLISVYGLILVPANF